MNDLREIDGIGPKIEKYFNNLLIWTKKDLLYYFPKDYEEYEVPTKIIDLVEGKVATIEGIIVSKPSTFKKGRLSITHVTIDDGTQKIKAYWFNIPFISHNLVIGKTAIFRGKVMKTNAGLALSQSKMYSEHTYSSLQMTLNPIYSLTKGLTQDTIRKAIKKVIDKGIENNVQDYLSSEELKDKKLCSLSYALSHIHFPNDFNDMLIARKRLVYDEFFLFSYAMLVNKTETLREGREELKNIDKKYIEKLKNKLSYKLTNSQETTLKDIFNDFNKGIKMNRLIEGDVGSGKTIVAILTAFAVVNKKLQVAFMAPTEVLAKQHYENILNVIGDCNDDEEKLCKVAYLTGSTKTKARKELLKDLKDGNINILVGTHALFSKDVEYNDLGLIIIDEQHKFGVAQRKALEEKSKNVNVLVMSATPIPRTLAMLFYADMDLSRLTDKPKNRLSIKNCVISKNDREKGYKAIKKEIDAGHQAYVICAAIENIEESGSFANYQNVIDYAKNLKLYFGQGYNIEVLHGKMKSKEKEEIMNRFKDGEIDILVSTTVVEVGIDVPNATFIMIEDAGNFGLAELHQLRGRVGRGSNQSYALFVDTLMTSKSKERLNILKNSNDGFFLSEEDLRLRGPGDIFGVRQAGSMEFKIADMYTDIKIFREAMADAKKYIDKNGRDNVYGRNETLKNLLDEYLKNGYTI